MSGTTLIAVLLTFWAVVVVLRAWRGKHRRDAYDRDFQLRLLEAEAAEAEGAMQEYIYDWDDERGEHRIVGTTERSDR
mgnify:CR=1 FL=1